MVHVVIMLRSHHRCGSISPDAEDLSRLARPPMKLATMGPVLAAELDAKEKPVGETRLTDERY